MKGDQEVSQKPDPAGAILAYLHQVGTGLDSDFLWEAVRVLSALLMSLMRLFSLPLAML